MKRVSGDANGTMIVDVTRAEGTVSQAGDAFSAVNMNDLEQRIVDAFTESDDSLSWKKIGVCTGGESVNISSANEAREFLCLFAFGNYRV
ncbi:MAG: hypothetical protein NC321_16130, partial [Clostridium sp.]|nr:hypothetical protein [Clostridium sp.]